MAKDLGWEQLGRWRRLRLRCSAKPENPQTQERTTGKERCLLLTADFAPCAQAGVAKKSSGWPARIGNGLVLVGPSLSACSRSSFTPPS